MMSFASVAWAASGDSMPDYRANSMQLIPEAENQNAINAAYKTLTSSESQHQFWDKYNEVANSTAFDPSETS